MKRKLTPHSDGGGPSIHIELDDVSIIEEYGDRTGRSGWVKAKMTMISGKEINIILSLNDMDDLVDKWENGVIL